MRERESPIGKSKEREMSLCFFLSAIQTLEKYVEEREKGDLLGEAFFL
jgi:hypothetical protein